ncbi:hypothetical protein [Shinella sp.]|uniref:hypothetical protein n=1 Tax=Shinella sp. TaxID=1870904 RepID=UPI00258F759E|nr:hypothetical protein [Shinella sp.]MCO5136266.1 hypothetical protein [Shinella sp.]
MGDTLAWGDVPAFGGLTLIVGAVLAIRQTDLKLMLAYTAVSLLVMLTGFGSQHAVAAAISISSPTRSSRSSWSPASSIRDSARHHPARRAQASAVTPSAALFAALSMAGRPSSASSPRRRSMRHLPAAAFARRRVLPPRPSSVTG